MPHQIGFVDNSGGVLFDFNNTPQNFTYNGGTFTLQVNDVSLTNTGGVNAVPLTGPDGVVRTWMCGRCFGPALDHDHGGRAPHTTECVDESRALAESCCLCALCKRSIPDSDPGFGCAECRPPAARLDPSTNAPHEPCLACAGTGDCPNCNGDGFTTCREVPQ